MSQRNRREEKKSAMRCGASRKSSALRVGGVSTTIRSYALRVDLVEPLHRDVVVRLDEARRDVLVQRVGQDLLAGLGVGCMRPDEVVPTLLGVEHRRPQLSPRGGRRPGERLVGDADLVVPDPLQAERVGQPSPGRP